MRVSERSRGRTLLREHHWGADRGRAFFADELLHERERELEACAGTIPREERAVAHERTDVGDLGARSDARVCGAIATDEGPVCDEGDGSCAHRGDEAARGLLCAQPRATDAAAARRSAPPRPPGKTSRSGARSASESATSGTIVTPREHRTGAAPSSPASVTETPPRRSTSTRITTSISSAPSARITTACGASDMFPTYREARVWTTCVSTRARAFGRVSRERRPRERRGRGFGGRPNARSPAFAGLRAREGGNVKEGVQPLFFKRSPRVPILVPFEPFA